MADDKDLNRFVEELRAWDADIEPLRETMRRMWAEWTPPAPGEQEKDPKIGTLSKVRIPWGYHAVETMVPRVVGAEPSIAYRALDDTDDIPIAHVMGALVTSQLERMGFEYEVRNFIRQGMVANYTVAKVGWIREQIEVEIPETAMKRALGTVFQVDQSRTETVTVRNAPFFETINVAEGDFVWPLTAKSIDEAPALWQRRWVTKRYLEEHADVYSNLDRVKGNASSRYRDSKRDRVEKQGGTLGGSPYEDLDEEDGIVELWERWTDDYLCAIANPLDDAVKIRGDDNPFQHERKPFVDWAPVPHPFQLHGVGVIQSIYDQNEALNTLHRQVSDALTYMINPAWKSRGGAGTQLTIFPGFNLDLDELEDIEPLTMPQVDLGAAFAWLQGIREDMQRTTGAHDWLAGAPSRGTQTATETATISEEGNKRIAEMIKVFDERTMKRLGFLLSMMNTQYVDSDVVADFTTDPAAAQAWNELAGAQAGMSAEDGPVPVTPEMVKARGRLEPIPQVGQDKLLSSIQKRSDATQALQALAPLLGIPAVSYLMNFPELAGWVLEQFGVDKMSRQRILQQNPQQIEAIAAQAALDAGPQESGPSGESGENAPTGDVVGAPGVAGGIGPFDQGGGA